MFEQVQLKNTVLVVEFVIRHSILLLRFGSESSYENNPVGLRISWFTFNICTFRRSIGWSSSSSSLDRFKGLIVTVRRDLIVVLCVSFTREICRFIFVRKSTWLSTIVVDDNEGSVFFRIIANGLTSLFARLLTFLLINDVCRWNNEVEESNRFKRSVIGTFFWIEIVSRWIRNSNSLQRLRFSLRNTRKGFHSSHSVDWCRWSFFQHTLILQWRWCCQRCRTSNFATIVNGKNFFFRLH